MNYACFISYAHGEGKYVKPVIEAIHEELMSQLEMHFEEKVYLDTKRLLPGYEYNEQLAQTICRSACMVVAYAPVYGQKPYCRRELAAMEELANQRKGLLGQKATGHSFIIPVVITGGINSLPSRLKCTTHVCDLSSFTLSSHRLRHNTNFSKALEPVCRYIVEVHKLLGDNRITLENQVNCAAFALPDIGKIAPWEQADILPFPGRKAAP